MIADERKRLLQTGVFKKEIDTVLFLLVKLIGSKEGPAGSWTLKEDFEKILNYFVCMSAFACIC